MSLPIAAEGFDFEHWAKVLGFFVALVTLGYGTLLFLKLWHERKRSVQDLIVGRWEWTTERQVLEIVFKPDGSWEGRVLEGKGILGTLYSLFAGNRIAGTWWIGTASRRTLNIRDAAGKWHVEDRIVKVKQDVILLCVKGELVRMPTAADLEAAKPAPLPEPTPPPA
jgi:hypothetical protein